MKEMFDCGNSFAGYRKAQVVYLPLDGGRSLYLIGYDIKAGETVRVDGKSYTAPTAPGLYMIGSVASENNIHLGYKFIRYSGD